MSGEEPRAPGWYPDPWGGSGERYFDGTSWARDVVDALPDPRPKRRGGRLTWAVGGVVAVGAIATVAYVALGNAGEPSSLSATTTSSRGRSTTTTTRPTIVLDSYSEGDCATWNQAQTEATAELVDCAEPHLIELVESKIAASSLDHSPTEAEWDYIDATVCAPLVERYLHAKIDPQGEYHASSIRPTEEGWASGDRRFHCGIIVKGNTGSRNLIPFSGRGDAHAQYHALAPGSCMPAGVGDQLSGVVVPCTQPHVLEISGAVDLTGRIDHAPSDDELKNLVRDECDRVATAYLGHTPGDDLSAGWFGLEPGSWDAGHRIVECTLARYSGDTRVVLNAPLRAG
jgi:hypothetical protein